MIIEINDQMARAAIHIQGLQAFDDFLTLTKKYVTNICSNIRKPGGMVPSPARDQAAPVAGMPPVIPNPGIQQGHIYEKRLKML
jgi:hypothetical protein